MSSSSTTTKLNIAHLAIKERLAHLESNVAYCKANNLELANQMNVASEGETLHAMAILDLSKKTDTLSESIQLLQTSHHEAVQLPFSQ